RHLRGRRRSPVFHHKGAFMKLKLLVGATAAALFAIAAVAQSPSGSMSSGSAGSPSVGSSPSTGGSSGLGGPSGTTGTPGSTIGGSGTGTGSTTGLGGTTSGAGTSGGSQRCATLIGLDRDRCLRDEGL